MEYTVFLIYAYLIAQTIMNSFGTKRENKGNYICKGYQFYKIRGVINITIGCVGMIAVNLFLRDKNIISQTFVWAALIGFILIMFYGMYCIYKMITSTNP